MRHRATGAIAATCLMLSACSAGQSSRSKSSFDGLTPNVPTREPGATYTCDDFFAASATTIGGTIALANCTGQVGYRPTPTVTMTTGQQLLITGMTEPAALTLTTDVLGRVAADTFVAKHAGRDSVVVTGYGPGCAVVENTQPTSCVLLSVTVGPG